THASKLRTCRKSRTHVPGARARLEACRERPPRRDSALSGEISRVTRADLAKPRVGARGLTPITQITPIKQIFVDVGRAAGGDEEQPRQNPEHRVRGPHDAAPCPRR